MEVLPSQPSWWSGTSWFAGGGLQDAAAAAAALEPAPGAQQLPAEQQAESLLVLVGGARAQSRFSGKTAIPIGTCAPLSSASVARVPPQAQAQRAAPLQLQTQQQQSQQQQEKQQQQAGTTPAVVPTRHAAWGSAAGVGHTVDGSMPSAASNALPGEHVSRWVFDTRSWRWVVRGQSGEGHAAQQMAPSDKHRLAARRWGDGRDSLGAAALAAPQPQQADGAAQEVGPAAMAAAAAPAKRPRLQIGAMTGDASDAGFASVGGLARQKELLLEHIAYPLLHPRLFTHLGVSGARGVLLHGPPGSGKTHLVRALAAEARLPIVCLNGGECVGEHAERNMRRAFNAAKSQAPCILLLDELDAMAPSRAHSHSEHERQATARLLSAVDELRRSRVRVGLVGTTNRRAAVDAALRRAGRLDSEVALAALGQEERLAVLRCCTQHMPLDPSTADLAAVAAQLRGYVGADVAAVASEAGLLCAVQAVHAAEAAGRPAEQELQRPDFLEGLRVTGAHFAEAASRLGPSVLRGLAPDVPEVSFDQVGGLEEVKTALRELVEFPLRHGALLDAYGLPAPRGALLYGPPGCGKTLLAKAAAAQCGANFLSVRGPELLQKWLGESEAAVRQTFETARQAAPCLIFFDEIDSIACRRGSGGGGSSSAGDATAARVLNQLLVEMDGMADRGGVFVLCATNRPEALDPALTRPGRLDHLLRVPLPDQPARLSILRSCLARCPLSEGANEALAALAGAPTLDMSGADLGELCRRAGMAAIRELVAAEEAWLAQQQAGQAGGSGSGSNGGSATSANPLAAAPLQLCHLEAALASIRRSVSQEESQRHARIEQCLTDGSLPAPDAPAQGGEQAAAAVREAVQAAVKGSVERQLSRLQYRVRQLEEFVRASGLEVPLPAAGSVQTAQPQAAQVPMSS